MFAAFWEFEQYLTGLKRNYDRQEFYNLRSPLKSYLRTQSIRNTKNRNYTFLNFGGTERIFIAFAHLLHVLKFSFSYENFKYGLLGSILYGLPCVD